MYVVCIFFGCIFRVTSPENYFLSELSYTAESKLTDCKPLSLHVMALGDRSLCIDNIPSEFDSRSTVQGLSTVNVLHEIMKAKKCTAGGRSCEISADNKDCLSNDSDVATEAENKLKFSDVDVAVKRLSKMLSSDLNTECFILDIDLDFFSTTNPFLSSLSSQQYQLLTELYAYTPPSDSSNEVC